MKQDYPNLIKTVKKEESLSDKQNLKIALLSSYTIKNIGPSLTYKLLKEGFNPEIKLGGFNQFLQELLDKKSWLYSFNPEVIFIALSSETFIENLEYTLANMSTDELKSLIDNKLSSLENAIIQCGLTSKIIISNLNVPSYSPYSLMDPTISEGIENIITEFNKKLVELSINTKRFNVLNFEKVCSFIGKSNITDPKMYYLGKILLNDTGCEALSTELVRTINAIYGRVKKCLVVDLDNTIWGGVIGEAGINGIKIGGTNIGHIYSDIQKILLNYKKSGTLLAIASKNNPEDVSQVFKENENMILKEEDFIAKKINWDLKSQNIKAIADELNIGLDSLVFLDDNPVERLEVKTNLSMVKIINFPKDIANLPSLLKEMPYFQTLNITEEDGKRNEMYMWDKKRDVLKGESSLLDYLKSLKTEISISEADLNSVERITQLVNKTNQFNLRTQRYTSEQIRAFIESEDYIILSLKVKDKFGDLGLTGVMIIHKENGYFIDTFLMSCRILSRNIEKEFFKEALNFLDKNESELRAEYIPTQKNKQVESFYESLGFNLMEDEKNKSYRKIMIL